jgi:hypothetical protein
MTDQGKTQLYLRRWLEIGGLPHFTMELTPLVKSARDGESSGGCHGDFLAAARGGFCGPL